MKICMNKELLNAKQAASYLGMSRGTFDKLKHLITVTFNTSRIKKLYDIRDLNSFVEVNTIRPA